MIKKFSFISHEILIIILCILFYLLHFQIAMLHFESLFTPWKFWLIKYTKYWFCACIYTFDWYLFQLIVLLKSDFNWSSFPLSWVWQSSYQNIKFCISYCMVSSPLRDGGILILKNSSHWRKIFFHHMGEGGHSI